METEVIQVRLLKNGPPNSTVFVLGPTGRGKTTLIANLIAAEKRFLIFDAKNDYNPEFFGKGTVQVQNVPEMATHFNSGTKRIIFKVRAIDDESDQLLNDALGFVCQFQVANPNQGSVIVSLDELNRFTDSHNAPDNLREITERGRDYRINKVYGAQWFNSVPTWLRSSFSEIYTFQYSESVGLNKLKDYGFDPEQVKNLPAYTCLHTGKSGIRMIRLSAS